MSSARLFPVRDSGHDKIRVNSGIQMRKGPGVRVAIRAIAINRRMVGHVLTVPPGQGIHADFD